jgi:hypothetical protein
LLGAPHTTGYTELLNRALSTDAPSRTLCSIVRYGGEVAAAEVHQAFCGLQ